MKSAVFINNSGNFFYIYVFKEYWRPAVVILQPDISLSSNVSHFPSGLSLPIQDKNIIQLDFDTVPDEGDLEMVPLPGRMGRVFHRGFGIIGRSRFMDTLAGGIYLNLERVIDVIVAYRNFRDPEENSGIRKLVRAFVIQF